MVRVRILFSFVLIAHHYTEHHATVSGVQDADYLQLNRLGLSEADTRLAVTIRQNLHPQEVLDLLREVRVRLQWERRK